LFFTKSNDQQKVNSLTTLVFGKNTVHSRQDMSWLSWSDLPENEYWFYSWWVFVKLHPISNTCILAD